MWRSYPASLRNVGGSTQVPVRAWNNARKGIWGLPSPVKLERRQITFTVSMWRKTQNKSLDSQLHMYFKRHELDFTRLKVFFDVRFSAGLTYNITGLTILLL
jgi:hypothetical protein